MLYILHSLILWVKWFDMSNYHYLFCSIVITYIFDIIRLDCWWYKWWFFYRKNNLFIYFLLLFVVFWDFFLILVVSTDTDCLYSLCKFDESYILNIFAWLVNEFYVCLLVLLKGLFIVLRLNLRCNKSWLIPYQIN